MDGGNQDGLDPNDVRKITTIVRDDTTGEMTIHTPHDWRQESKGTMVTALDWTNGKTEGGKTVITQDDTFPIRGELVLLKAGGLERIPLSEVAAITGEARDDLRISRFIVWVSQNAGMYATDGSTGVVVSNGMRWTNKLDFEKVSDDSRPIWAARGPLVGRGGELQRRPGDTMIWVRGLYGMGDEQPPTSEAFAGWIQVGRNGRILDEAFTSGQPDTGWSGTGRLDWTHPSSFNPYDVPDLRLALMVNGFDKGPSELEALAARLNFPAHWRTLITPQAPDDPRS